MSISESLRLMYQQPDVVTLYFHHDPGKWMSHVFTWPAIRQLRVTGQSVLKGRPEVTWVLSANRLVAYSLGPMALKLKNSVDMT